MPEITTADLLRVQDTITGTVRHEVGLAREEFRTKFTEWQASQAAQDDRVDAMARELARVDERTKSQGSARGLIANLSPKQKAGLWSAAIAIGGAALDGLRHLITLVLKGAVQP